MRLVPLVLVSVSLGLLSASCGPTTAASCRTRRPIFYDGKCRTEQQLWEAFPCQKGNKIVLREPPPKNQPKAPTMRWEACCQQETGETHCLEFVRGEGQVGEEWICADKKRQTVPCKAPEATAEGS